MDHQHQHHLISQVVGQPNAATILTPSSVQYLVSGLNQNQMMPPQSYQQYTTGGASNIGLNSGGNMMGTSNGGGTEQKSKEGGGDYKELFSSIQLLQQIVSKQQNEMKNQQPIAVPQQQQQYTSATTSQTLAINQGTPSNSVGLNEQQQQQQQQLLMQQQQTLNQSITQQAMNNGGGVLATKQENVGIPTTNLLPSSSSQSLPLSSSQLADPQLMNTAYMNPYMFGMMQGYNPWMMGGGGVGGMGMMGNSSASAFHGQGPKNEIKLFVGALQFQTNEADLNSYFNQYGMVADSIVMRDKVTGRGRGFGFVRMIFETDDLANTAKDKILRQNTEGGHFILEKKVDVKSADDYQGKQSTSSIPPMGQTQGGAPIQKPNPYVIVKQGDQGNDIAFEYPKSKIFVGGLDFKLTVEELKQHFSQYGEVLDAIILKDIYTGQSRGFGFVTFKDEAVAQTLIKKTQVTTINGRKVDIKKSEPKQGGTPFIPNKNAMIYGNMPAMIGPYGSTPFHQQGDSSRSNSHDKAPSRQYSHKGGKKKSRRSSSSQSKHRSRSSSKRRDHHGNDRKKRHSRERGNGHDKSKKSNGSGGHHRHREDSREREKERERRKKRSSRSRSGKK